MISKSSKLLVEAGIIPKSALQEQVRFRNVDEDLVNLHGSRPVSSSSGSAAENFVEKLAEEMDSSASTIQQYEEAWGEEVSAWFEYADSGFDKSPRKVRRASGGRVYVAKEALPSVRKKVRRIAFESPRHTGFPVVSVEPRYLGNTIVGYVLFTEEK